MILCSGADCAKQASSLKCPMCMKAGLDVFFCDQVCFKRNWKLHKSTHAKVPGEVYDPFSETVYSGDLRAQYPLAPRRQVKETVQRPDYADDGQPRSEQRIGRSTAITVCDEKTIEKMRIVGKLAREVLDIAAAAIKPGLTTEEIDRIVHEACMERDAYPSTLNYYNFPASCCTSVNEVICHGIPDKRALQDGDIVNIDVTLYKLGVHSDLNETYYVGDKAKTNPDIVRLVETTREALDLAAKEIKPGQLFRNFGDIIEKHATKNKVSVVRTYVGHGVNELFHCPPNIPHYGRNKAIGILKPGMTFTIEPMLCLGSYRDQMWPDNWTSTTVDGKFSAQFVTDTGVEVLTARTADSPGGPVKRI